MSSKPLFQRRALPATARLGLRLGLGSFGTVPREGVIRVSLLHPPLTCGPLICGPHPTLLRTQKGRSQPPGSGSQDPCQHAGTQAKSWGEAHQVRSALTPTSGRSPRPRCCTQVSHSQCRANIAPPGPRPRRAADSPHSRARAPGAWRPLSCQRQGESGAPATPLAMPSFPNSRCKETKPG